MTIRNTLAYRLLIWGLLIASLLLLARMAPTLVNPKYLAADDFGHFWAAGRLNNQGQDPYDPRLILELLYQVGRPQETSGVVSVMLNPPWTLPIVMLFGLLSYPLSRLAWLLGNIAIVIICAEQLWRIYAGPKQARWLAWALAFTFTPAIAALQKGQFTPLVLLGLVGFLRLVDQIPGQSNQRRPRWHLLALAGCMLALIAIKPQLLYLFWLALLLWSLQQRNWQILFSGGLVLALATALPMLFNPNVIAQYFHNMAEFPLSEWATPTIGSYLRVTLGLEKFWLQFLPPALGSLWFLYYWFQRRQEWHWQSEMPLLLLVSLVTTPYSWTYDLILVLPAIIVAAIGMLPRLQRWPFKLADVLIIASYLALNVLNLALHRSLNEFWFGWLAPGLLLLFLIIRRVK
jgi:hypothetical protein